MVESSCRMLSLFEEGNHERGGALREKKNVEESVVKE
jgi:hypothetical protein